MPSFFLAKNSWASSHYKNPWAFLTYERPGFLNENGSHLRRKYRRARKIARKIFKFFWVFFLTFGLKNARKKCHTIVTKKAGHEAKPGLKLRSNFKQRSEKMKKKEITKWLFRAYLVYSVIADMVVLGGIIYLLLKLGG